MITITIGSAVVPRSVLRILPTLIGVLFVVVLRGPFEILQYIKVYQSQFVAYVSSLGSEARVLTSHRSPVGS